MIERVAQAILLRRVKDDFHATKDGSYIVDHDLEMARAAIAAMREPTEAMVIAGSRHESMGDMAGRWQAMVDEASK